MGKGYILFRAQGEELAGGLALYMMGICFILGMVGRCLGKRKCLALVVVTNLTTE